MILRSSLNISVCEIPLSERREGKKESDLSYVSAVVLAELISVRAVSPVETTDAVLRRIDCINPQLNAYRAIDESQVRPPHVTAKPR